MIPEFVGPPERGGRWKWPFSQMRIGDSFKVRPWHKSKADVYNTAKARGWQLNRYFHVTQDMEGNTLVECVGAPSLGYSRSPEGIDYFTAVKLIQSLYPTLKADELPIGFYVEENSSGFFPAPRRGHAVQPWLVVIMNHARQGLRLEDDGVWIQWLPDDMTLSKWTMAQMLS